MRPTKSQRERKVLKISRASSSSPSRSGESDTPGGQGLVHPINLVYLARRVEADRCPTLPLPRVSLKAKKTNNKKNSFSLWFLCALSVDVAEAINPEVRAKLH